MVQRIEKRHSKNSSTLSFLPVSILVLLVSLHSVSCASNKSLYYFFGITKGSFPRLQQSLCFVFLRSQLLAMHIQLYMVRYRKMIGIYTREKLSQLYSPHCRSCEQRHDVYVFVAIASALCHELTQGPDCFLRLSTGMNEGGTFVHEY